MSKIERFIPDERAAIVEFVAVSIGLTIVLSISASAIAVVVPEVDLYGFIGAIAIISILWSGQTILKREIDTKLGNPLLDVSDKRVRIFFAIKSLNTMPPLWIFYTVAYLFSIGVFPLAAFVTGLFVFLSVYALIATGVYSYPIRTEPDPEFHGLAKIRLINYGVKGLLHRITNDDPEIGRHTKYLLSQKGPYSAIQYLTARTGVTFDKARYLLPLLAHHHQRL